VLDVLLIGLLVGAAVGGYRLGFVARAASWIGMLVGILVAARLMPGLLDRMGPEAGRVQVLAVAAGVLIGGAAVGQSIGVLIGDRIQLGITSRAGRAVDAGGGAVAGVLGLLVVVWLLIPALADVQGMPAREVRRSRIIAGLTEALPAAPDATRALRQVLGDGFPQVFDDLTRSPDVGPPPEGSGLSSERAQQVSASVVKVAGEACGRIQSGTGFAVGDDLVVTNAHVVAGEPATEVQRQDGSSVPAALVAFDPERDLAVLSAPGLGAASLPIAESAVGQTGAVFGHPGGGPLELSPFDVRQRVTARGADIYGRPGVERDVLVLASDLAPGDSGSALVDGEGRVVGVAFAVAPDRDGVAYALSTDELRSVLAEVGSGRVDAGPCTT
jgi:S1-C subfamily serine protease